MRRILGVLPYLCVFVLVLGLVACGGNDGTSGAGQAGGGQSASQPAGAAGQTDAPQGDDAGGEAPDGGVPMDNPNLAQGALTTVDDEGRSLVLTGDGGPIAVAVEQDAEILLETLVDGQREEKALQPADLLDYMGAELVTCQGSYGADGVFQAARVIVRNTL